MKDLITSIESPQQIVAAARRLREQALKQELPPARAIELLERWGAALRRTELESIPGVAFLRLWLRRGTLEPLVARELGAEALRGQWQNEGEARLRAFPLGVIGHWPAGNIEIQPLLSLSCSLLAGNAGLVRVPTGLIRETRAILDVLQEVDREGTLIARTFFAAFDHARMDLQQAMAQSVDGAMIWGGRDAVTQIRALPFPHWARVLAFGPRLSVAAMDGATWGDDVNRGAWCRRIARDVWQFDQQACSSPQTLFLEGRADCDIAGFVAALAQALREENSVHPRQHLDPGMTSAICLARASWLLRDSDHRAVFPETPDWTILVGSGSEVPDPVQGRTLTVLVVPSLCEPIARFDGTVQTLGLAVKSPSEAEALARLAAANGVDRIVKLGRMHVFGSPWDGTDMIRPMVRLVRYQPAYAADP